MLICAGILPLYAKMETPALLNYTMQYKRKQMKRAAFWRLAIWEIKWYCSQLQAVEAKHGKGGGHACRDQLNTEYAMPEKRHSFLDTLKGEF